MRLRTCDEEYTKCHVECQLEEPKCKKAACAPGCLPEAGCAGVVVTQPAAMPQAEKIPLPKDK